MSSGSSPPRRPAPAPKTLRKSHTDLSTSSGGTALNAPSRGHTDSQVWSRRSTVEGVLTVNDMQTSTRLEQKEVLRCRETLSNILAGKNQVALDQEFHRCVMFKNRLVIRCQVLHFAVMEAARLQNGFCVSEVLEAKADVNAKAMYVTVKDDVTYETELEAIHLAAGLGSLEAMRALSNAASNVPRLVSSFATVNIKGCDQRFDFYCPIHDAAYLGQKDAVLWLLEHKARADAINKDGCTPLHFIALIGGRGNLMDSDVQEVVSALLTHCANLDARSFSAQQPYPCDPFLQQKIPLEIAAETQYPKDLMYLMAASFQSINFDNPRAFADIRLLSKCNMKVAEDFTHDLLERARNDSTLLDMLIKEAQMNGAVDRIAALLYMVPHAGAEILDALTVPPVIQDAAKHPLPSRAPLHTGPARCTYQPDMVQRRDLMWPQWEYDADNQVQKRWHARFVPKRAADIRQDNVYDVDVKVVLLPNLLDVDIFMALTRTWETHNHVFAKLPIQGAIYCLWDQLLWPVFASHWLFMGLELGVLLWWGLQPSEVRNRSSNSLQNLHRFWSILLSGAVREGLNLLWWSLAHWSKWHSHTDATMKSLWHPVNFFTDAWFLSSLLTLSCRLLLVLPCLYDSFFPDHDPVMSEWEQGMLAINTFAQGFAVTYMLRLLHRFKRILAIFKTFFSRTILEMLLIALMIFASFSFAFLTLIRREHAAWTVTYLYRGLMFGDGDGLDRMGLMLGSDNNDNKVALVLFMVSGTILFNITILNLVIAIYGNEYERVNAETELHFMKERAKYSLIYVEMLHKQRLMHIVKELAHVSSVDVPVVSKMILLATQSVLTVNEWHQRLLGMLKPQLARCQLARWQVLGALAPLALAAAPWLLKALLRILDTLPILGACLISISQIAWQAMLIQADWFQPDAPELAPGVEVVKTSGEGHGVVECQQGDLWKVKLSHANGEEFYLAKESELAIQNCGFLWICHRSDYAETFFFETEEVSRKDLDHVAHQLDETNKRLDHLERVLGDKLDVLLKLSDLEADI
ncbi:unnamed protein product [Effrenium voratum]|nr:unnamed protein product [Effrenium voratum]